MTRSSQANPPQLLMTKMDELLLVEGELAQLLPVQGELAQLLPVQGELAQSDVLEEVVVAMLGDGPHPQAPSEWDEIFSKLDSAVSSTGSSWRTWFSWGRFQHADRPTCRRRQTALLPLHAAGISPPRHRSTSATLAPTNCLGGCLRIGTAQLMFHLGGSAT